MFQRQTQFKEKLVTADQATKAKVTGNIFVDRRPLLERGFKPSEIVDDWDTIINPYGVLNAENATVIVDLNHNSDSTGARFLGYEKTKENIDIGGEKYNLPVLKGSVLFQKGNTGKIGSHKIDVFDIVRSGKATGWSAGFRAKDYYFYDDNWQDVTEEVKSFVGEGNWALAPNMVKMISKEMNKRLYCLLDSYYLVTLSLLTETQQGHYDAGFDKVIFERGVDTTKTLIYYRQVNLQTMSKVEELLNNDLLKQLSDEQKDLIRSLEQPAEETPKEEEKSGEEQPASKEEAEETPKEEEKSGEETSKEEEEPAEGQPNPEIERMQEEWRGVVSKLETRIVAVEKACGIGDKKPDVKREQDEEEKTLEEIRRQSEINTKTKEETSKVVSDKPETQATALRSLEKVQEEKKSDFRSKILLNASRANKGIFL